MTKNMISKTCGVMATCAFLTTFSPANAADVTLVQDGEARASLVFAADDLKGEQAVNEIQKYLEKMSGAKLPVVKEGSPVETPGTVFIGHTKAAKKLGVKIPSGFNPSIRPEVFEEEGFVIKTVDQQVVLGGNSDGPYQGTNYAAYELLELLGCRFYFPGEWGEVVPQKRTVVLPETDLVSKPDFPMRSVYLGGWIPSTKEEREIYKDWERKIKFTPAGRFYPVVGDGFLGYLLPPAEFFASDPELYAMDKSGSRQPRKNFINGVMLSLDNPKVFELSVQNLKGAMGGDTKSAIKRIMSPNGFGISPPDGASFDYDPMAIELNQNFNYPNYVNHPMTSEEFFGFAAKLAKEFPDKWVSTMAYSGRELPPQGVTIPPNMSVMYAPIASCVLHPFGDPGCWRRQETLSIMRQWTRLCDHVYLRDYNPGLLLGSFVPEADVANFSVSVKEYRDMGLKGFQAEGRKTFMITWLSCYMRSRLMWDADADVEAIKKDFYTTFFGPEAGPSVQQWWDACEQALNQATMHAHEDWLLDHIYTVEFTKRLHEYVKKAAASEMTPEQKPRFEAFALIADHLEAYALRNEAEKQLDFGEALKQSQRMEDATDKLAAMYSFFTGPKVHPDFNNGWMERFAQFKKMTDGGEGTLVAKIPLEARFQRDLYNEGVLAEWYAPDYDDANWGMKNTFQTWDAQDEPEDAKGHDYDGYGWYRMVVDVPVDAAGKPGQLHFGGVINEGWVWVNGEYAGHRKWYLWWAGRKALEMDVDVTGLLKPGPNVITLRVLNTSEVGGLIRRGFLWAPKK